VATAAAQSTVNARSPAERSTYLIQASAALGVHSEWNIADFVEEKGTVRA